MQARFTNQIKPNSLNSITWSLFASLPLQTSSKIYEILTTSRLSKFQQISSWPVFQNRPFSLRIYACKSGSPKPTRFHYFLSIDHSIDPVKLKFLGNIIGPKRNNFPVGTSAQRHSEDHQNSHAKTRARKPELGFWKPWEQVNPNPRVSNAVSCIYVSKLGPRRSGMLQQKCTTLCGKTIGGRVWKRTLLIL